MNDISIPSYPLVGNINLYVYGRAETAPPKVFFDDLSWFAYVPGTIETHNYTYTYSDDGMNRLEEVLEDGNVIKSFTYDSLGRIATRRDGRVQQRMAYDVIGRLSVSVKPTPYRNGFQADLQLSPGRD